MCFLVGWLIIFFSIIIFILLILFFMFAYGNCNFISLFLMRVSLRFNFLVRSQWTVRLLILSCGIWDFILLVLIIIIFFIYVLRNIRLLINLSSFWSWFFNFILGIYWSCIIFSLFSFLNLLIDINTCFDHSQPLTLTYSIIVINLFPNSFAIT
jgi:hypothetical protein